VGTAYVSEAETNRELVQQLKPFRRELLAHCYRMLGSVDDAEDAVQETHLRAWGSRATLEDPAALRGWLYRIATNVCLSTLEQRKRREIPSGLGAPSDQPAGPIAIADEVDWVEPIPDALIVSQVAGPAAITAMRESVRLAFVASLQYLPPRQRAVLLLREVLGFSAEESAAALDLSVAAVKSALQRARAALDERMPSPSQMRDPTHPDARAVLDSYMAAFEHSDANALERLLLDDAVLEMTPARTWFAGKTTCMPYLRLGALGVAGEWRMVPTIANGQPAAIAYRRGDDGRHHPFGVALLVVRDDRIARISVFHGAGIVKRFEALE
jgi:RNA polymerase sigma-70 factor (ECF subfamily)